MESAALGEFYLHLEYDETDLEGLERSVYEQMSQGTYRFEANLTILKYYSMYPNSYKVEIVARILVLALMRLPSTDFTEALYQIPQHCLREPPIAELMDLESTLETCQFRDFWKKVETAEPQLKKLLYSAGHFEESVRKFTAETIGFSCLKVSTADFLTLLNLADANDPKFIKLIASLNWAVSRDGVITTGLRVDAPSKAEDHVTEASRNLKTSMVMLAK